MKNLRRIFGTLWSSRKTKVLVASLLTAGVVSTAVAVFAGYGPGNRPVFDWNNPADQVGSLKGPVLNSFINTPVYGDERAFVDGKDASITQPGGFQDQVPVTPGNDYTIRVYVHNNANPSLNCLPVHLDANGNCTQVDDNAPGISQNTTVRLNIPTGVVNDDGITGYISDSNGLFADGTPGLTQVYDTVDLRNPNQGFIVSYVPGSAEIDNQAHPNGMQLSDDIVTNGVKIGFDQMDGNLPGCFQYSAYVTIKVHVSAPQLKITKQVRLPGDANWNSSVNAQPGQTVQWLVEVTNPGDTVEHDVVANDLLPPHLTFVPGSAKWYSASANGVAYDFSQFQINNGNGGYNFGNYAGNGGSFLVRFDTVVNGDFTPCSLTIRNIANTHSTEVPQDQQAFADVNITKANCNATPPVFSCDLLKADTTTPDIGQTVNFTVNATAQNGATVTGYSYDFGDGSTSNSSSNTASHVYNSAGSFTATAKVTFNVNGQSQTIGGNGCKVTITPKQQTPPSFSCDLLKANNVTPDLGQPVNFTVNATANNGATITGYSFDFGDGSTSNTTSNTASHTYNSAGNFMATAKVTFNVNGQTQTVGGNGCQVTISPKQQTPPKFSCDLLTANPTNPKIGQAVTFTTSATAQNGATVNQYIYDFGDGSSATIANPNNTVNHMYSTAGNITASVQVSFNVNGQTQTIGGNNCQVKVSVQQQPAFSCDMLAANPASAGIGQTVTFTTSATATNGATVNLYIYDFGDGNSTTVANPNNTATHAYTAAGTYTANVKIAFNVNGGVQTVGGDACQVKVTVQQNPPAFSCDLLKVDAVQGQAAHTFQFTVNTTATNGATVNQYMFTFGDGQTLNTTNNVVTHTFTGNNANNQFVTTVQVQFNVDKTTKTATSNNCTQLVSFTTPIPTPPTQLVNTGSGDVVGIFAAATVVGAVLHRVFLVRRFGRR